MVRPSGERGQLADRPARRRDFREAAIGQVDRVEAIGPRIRPGRADAIASKRAPSGVHAISAIFQRPEVTGVSRRDGTSRTQTRAWRSSLSTTRPSVFVALALQQRVAFRLRHEERDSGAVR